MNGKLILRRSKLLLMNSKILLTNGKILLLKGKNQILNKKNKITSNKNNITDKWASANKGFAKKRFQANFKVGFVSESSVNAEDLGLFSPLLRKAPDVGSNFTEKKTKIFKNGNRRFVKM